MLARGYDVWLLDADRIFRKTGTHAPFACVEEARRIGIDVMGFKDKSQFYMNFGMFWSRSTTGNIALAKRVYNRTFGAWDQYIWNQEISLLKRLCMA